MLVSRCSTGIQFSRTAARFRLLATVSPSFIPTRQPPPPPTPVVPDKPEPSYIDSQILKKLDGQPQTGPSLSDIIGHYIDQTGNVLDVVLPYESLPSPERRIKFEDTVSSKEIVTVAHCVKNGEDHRIGLSSGFAVNAPALRKGEKLIVTCAHTLEQIRASSLLIPKEFPPPDTSHHPLTGTFICIGLQNSMKIYPATEIVSSLPRSDVILISCELPEGALKTLPLSPYPLHAGAPIRAHFVSHKKPSDDQGWSPWIGDTWARWAKGNVLGYRDFSGRETKPGTYDSLSHMLFTPSPTGGSSGGPIVDEETGAVVGMMLGSRMDDHVQGARGWGIPSETIYEMFTLPGLESKK
ncbi:hypothetical protein D9611_003254 [Ephemerocybe angulata]|uniref:Uncharacterized protein n=1 Tax=Ephemerocybe angulata TaxID=980116 RepID=A0A8H5C8V5_9AGAR|nr:hypothetical protein D9611_003254 [Tulosesus angulatus]